jgi:hypothetical protein
MLPFTREQFLAVFVVHNQGVWPAQLACEHSAGGRFARVPDRRRLVEPRRRWNTPWFLVANHAAIALAIAWLLWRRGRPRPP